jgi:uncharacterized protein (DUF433 family)
VNAFLAKDEGVMLGKPTVAGTRLTVELILERRLKLTAVEAPGIHRLTTVLGNTRL